MPTFPKIDKMQRAYKARDFFGVAYAESKEAIVDEDQRINSPIMHCMKKLNRLNTLRNQYTILTLTCIIWMTKD